jgi:hypothetical protein
VRDPQKPDDKRDMRVGAHGCESRGTFAGGRPTHTSAEGTYALHPTNDQAAYQNTVRTPKEER